MKKIIKITLAMCAALSAVSCIHKDFDLPVCERHVRIIPQWVNTQPKGPDPVDMHIMRTNGYDKDTVSTSLGIDVNLMPAHYDITAWEESRNITVEKRAVTVAYGDDFYAYEPDPFAGGVAEAEVINYADPTDRVQTIYVPMRQQTRDLVIELTVEGDRFGEVTDLDLVLTGVALSRDISYGFPVVGDDVTPPAIISGNMQYDMVEDTGSSTPGAWMYTDTKTLLGFNGNASQSVYCTVTFNGTDKKYYTVDVTGELVGFHSVDVSRPWLLRLLLPLDDQAVFDIIGWKEGPEVPPIVAE